MSYLKFDKSLMINLEQSLQREILRTNKSGAYHCTTIVGCNTRKQHGLLVIPIPEMDDDNHVMLSSLDETVIQHGAPFNLGIQNLYIAREQVAHKIYIGRCPFRYHITVPTVFGIPQRQRYMRRERYAQQGVSTGKRRCKFLSLSRVSEALYAVQQTGRVCKRPALV